MKKIITPIADFDSELRVRKVDTLSAYEKSKWRIAKMLGEIPPSTPKFYLKNLGWYTNAGGDPAPTFYLKKFSVYNAKVDSDYIIRFFAKTTGTVSCALPFKGFKRIGNYGNGIKSKSTIICQLEGELACYYIERVQDIGYIITAFFKFCKDDIEIAISNDLREQGYSKWEADRVSAGNVLINYYDARSEYYREVCDAFLACQTSFDPHYVSYGYCYETKEWGAEAYYKTINRSTLLGY